MLRSGIDSAAIDYTVGLCSQIIGIYNWSGNNPIIPELWMVPDFLPVHPGTTLSL